MRSAAALRRRAPRAALALVVLAGALAGACGGGGATSASTTADPHTFVDLVSQVPADLDETATPDAASVAILPSWSSELVRPAPAAPGPGAQLPPDSAVVPYLATSWQRSANGSYTFALRRGVRGVSGDPFTAADVSWSLRRAIARSAVAPFLFTLAHIDTADPVTVLGPYSVRVNTTSPSPFTLSVLASYDAGIYDAALYRSHATAADPWALAWGSRHSASFGAYWVSFFDPASAITLSANPGFWRRPYYTRVVIRAVADPTTRLDEVLSGSATHTSDLPWSEFQEAIDASGAAHVDASVLQTGPGVYAWHLNVASGPLSHVQVRQAINLGIDREVLVDQLDAPFQPTSGVIPAAFGGAQPNDFDPQQSRSLIRAAGYQLTGPSAIHVKVYLNDGALAGNGPEILAALDGQMAEIGILLDPTYIDDPDQLLSLEQHGALESTIDADTPLLGGAGFLLEETANTALDPVSAAAIEHYSSASLQSTLAQLASSSGGSATDALISQAAQTLNGDVPTVQLAAIPVQNLTRANVTGYAAYTQPVTYYEDLHPVGAAR